MIVLDTNVLSEPLRPAPSPAVPGWLDCLLATRNGRAFKGSGVDLIDPWDQG